MRDERLEPAVVLEHIGLVLALIDQLDADPGIEKGQLAQALGQRVVVELDVREDLRGGLEADRRAALARCARNRQRRRRLPQMVLLAVDVTVTANRKLQVVG